MLSAEIKKEMRELGRSSRLREDMRYVAEGRHNPFFVDGKTDMNRLIEFLTESNAFINHKRRPFRRIKDKIMKL